MLDTDFKYTHLVEKAKLRDGDGDGKVNDGKPNERPATPAEIARGRKARKGRTAQLIARIQNRGKKPAPKKAAAKKKAADKRPAPKKAGQKPARADVTPKWTTPSGKVGADVTVTDADGKKSVISVIGDSKDDVRSQIEELKTGDTKVEAIDPPKAKIVDAPNAQGQLKRKGRDAPQADADAAPDGAKPDGAPEPPKKPDTPEEKPEPMALQTAAPDKPESPDAVEASLTPKKDGTPFEVAEAHFAAGGSIATAPAGSDVMAAIRNNPDRFDVIKNSEDTSSETSIVVDKSTKAKKVKVPGIGETEHEVFFVKRTSEWEGGDFIVHDDTANEAIVGALFEQMGYDVPAVQTSGSHWSGQAYTMQQHAGQVLPPNKNIRTPTTSKEQESIYRAMDGMKEDDSMLDWADAMEQAAPGLVGKLSESSDPGGMLRIALADFLTLNQDRNTGNFFLVHNDKNDDHTVMPIDNGFSFEGGLDTFFEQTGRDDFYVPQDMDEWLSFREPFGNMAAMSMGIGVAAVGRDSSIVASEIDDVIRKFEQTNIDAVLSMMKKQGASKEQLDMIRQSLRGMAGRVRWLKQNRDQVAVRLTT